MVPPAQPSVSTPSVKVVHHHLSVLPVSVDTTSTLIPDTANCSASSHSVLNANYQPPVSRVPAGIPLIKHILSATQFVLTKIVPPVPPHPTVSTATSATPSWGEFARRPSAT